MYVCENWMENIPDDYEGETAHHIFTNYMCTRFGRDGTQNVNQYDEETSFDPEDGQRELPFCQEHETASVRWEDYLSHGEIGETALENAGWYRCTQCTNNQLWFQSQESCLEHAAQHTTPRTTTEEEDPERIVLYPPPQADPDWMNLPWTAEPPLPDYAVERFQTSLSTNQPYNSYGGHVYDLRMPMEWVYTNPERHNGGQPGGVTVRRAADRIRAASLSGGWIEHHITFGPRATSTHGIWQ